MQLPVMVSVLRLEAFYHWSSEVHFSLKDFQYFKQSRGRERRHGSQFQNVLNISPT